MQVDQEIFPRSFSATILIIKSEEFRHFPIPPASSRLMLDSF